jgi:hypothetical protein
VGEGGPRPTRIEADDSSVYVPTVRAVWNLTGPREMLSEPRSGHAIEFGAMTASGGGAQSISVGQQPVTFGGQTFSAPQTLQHDFRVTHYDVFYRWRRFLDGGPVGFELLGGAAFSKLRLMVSSTTQQAAETFSSPGPSAGVGVIGRVRPGTSVQLRYTYTAFLSLSDLNQAQRGEGSLVQALGPNAAARVGYAWWRGDARRGSSSDIVVGFSGPTLGLEFQF